MRRFCHPLCFMAKQNRFSTPRHLIVNGHKVLVSAKSTLQPSALADALVVADRIWEHNQLNDQPNPFQGLTEPHFRAALKAKGYFS